MACNVINGDIGTVFELTVTDCDGAAIDISAAISLEINFKSPAGVVVNKTPVLSTDGSDGKMKYITLAGDINEYGKWIIQGVVELATGKWSTSTSHFYVDENI